MASAREQILEEIRRLAKANGGRAPGSRLFESQTGIRESSWRGRYWARWGDAVKEAGLKPNIKNEKVDEDFFLTKVAEVCRHFGKLPTAMEFRLYARSNPDVPDNRSIYRHFPTLKEMFDRLAEWSADKPEYADVVALFADHAPSREGDKQERQAEGYVYLIRSGAHYKIGRSDQLERRVKEIRVALPETAELLHSIRTDDPAGIEAYWHRRFADRRANGEWFKLTTGDVAAFRRRKFQ